MMWPYEMAVSEQLPSSSGSGESEAWHFSCVVPLGLEAFELPAVATLLLKVLLIDCDDERAEALRDQLAASGISEIFHLTGSANLVEQVTLLSPDVIVVDMASPDRDALEDIRQVSAVAPKPIILFADQDDPSFMEEAIAAGVSSYNVTGISLPNVKPIVVAAVALFRRYRQMERELEAAKATLEERRIIEKAKAILMRDRAMSEPDAYRWLRKKAMNESRKIVNVAADLVKKHASDARRA